MKTLLLALGLALVCRIQAIAVPQTMEHVNIQKLAGTWYPMAMAASDSSAENTFLGTYVKALRPTPESNLEIVLNRRENGRCMENILIAERTDSPVEFNINYLDQNKVFLLDTNQDRDLILCMESTVAPQPSLACQYLARTQKVQDKVMEQFHAVVRMLPMPMRVFRYFSQEEEQCRV